MWDSVRCLCLSVMYVWKVRESWGGGERGRRPSSQPRSFFLQKQARLAGPCPSPTLPGEVCPLPQSFPQGWDGSLLSGCRLELKRQEMSGGSPASCPASGEISEAAMEGRGAGLAARARCPKAVGCVPCRPCLCHQLGRCVMFADACKTGACQGRFVERPLGGSGIGFTLESATT